MADQDASYTPPAIIERREAVAYVEPRFSQAQRPTEELSLDFSQIIKMWLRRWVPAVAVGAVAAVGTIVVAMHAKPTYTATSQVVVEATPQSLVSLTNNANGGQPNQAPTDSAAVDTKVMMASSETLAERVVQRLHLLNDPEYVAKGKKATVAQVAEALRHHLTVRRAGLTFALQIEVKSHSAQKAADLANAFADEFINWEADSRSSLNDKSNNFVNDHLASLRREAEAADTEVQQYKIAHNLMSSAGQTIAEQQVGTLSAQIALAQADLAEKQSRLAAANELASRGGGNQDSTAALTSPTIAQLRTQQAETSRTLAELKAHYGPKYPDVQKAESQLADINANIQQEANRIHTSLQADASAAAQRLRSLRESQDVAQGSLASNNRAEVGLTELMRRADASRALYDAFLNRSKETSVQGSEEPDAQVFDRATVPTTPTSPNVRIAALFAVAIAIVAMALTVGLLEILDTSIRSSEDVAKRLGLPLLGVIPTPASSDKKFKRGTKMPPQEYLVKKPFSAYTEAFRNIRASLILPDRFGRRNQVVAIASSLPKEGKSTSAFCLMRTIAMSGTSVVLVDCDIRQRGVSNFLESDKGKGLVDVLQGTATFVDAAVLDTETPGWILPVTGPKGDQIDLFSSPKMDELLEELKERFDVVLLDTPAALAVSDARILASKADTVLFIAQWAKTPAKAIELGLETLTSVGGTVAGLVLSQVDLNRQARTTYGDGSRYYRNFAGYYQQ